MKKIAIKTVCLILTAALYISSMSAGNLLQSTFKADGQSKVTRVEIFHEAFNSGVPASWSNLDADADGYKWTADNNSVLSLSFNNAENIALNPDNWLISPAITASGETLLLEYYTLCGNPGFPAEKYSVCVSTSGTNPADFTEVFTETLKSGDHKWTLRQIALSALDGYSGSFYVAFRHYDCTGQYFIGIDEVKVLEGRYSCAAVRSLNFVQQGTDVTLVWEAPEGEAPNSYRLYDGHIEVANISDAKVHTFTNLSPGMHELSVAAIYEGVDCEAEKRTVSIQIDSCPEVSGLTVDYNSECEANIAWAVPSLAPASQLLWDQSEIGGNGFSQVIPWWKEANNGCVIADDFDAAEGWQIEEVYFHGWHWPIDYGGQAPDAFRIVFYSDAGNNIGQELYLNDELPYTVEYEPNESGDYIGIFTISLPEPFVIENEGKHWIAISAVYNADMPGTEEDLFATRFLIDFGDTQYGQKMRWRGDGEGLYTNTGNWQILNDSGGGEGDPYSMSFVLQGSIAPPAPLKYNVYRDGILVASEIEETSYIDQDFNPAMPHEWAVTVSCRKGGEANWIRIQKGACNSVDIANPLSETLKIYPNPASTLVNISGQDIQKVEIYNTVGQLVETRQGDVKTIDISSLDAGIYFFKVYDINSSIATKWMIKR